MSNDYIIGIAKQKQQSKRINSQKINREIFLSNLTENGKTIFVTLFDFADNNDLFFRWGTKGFSLNVKIEDKNPFLAICFGYLPNSHLSQTIYTGLGEISRKIENSDEILAVYKNKIEHISNFELTGKDYKWLINETSTIEDMNIFIEVLKTVVKMLNEI